MLRDGIVAPALVWIGLSLAAPALAAPRVELYTMGPGDYLFTKFGHGALCVFVTSAPEGLCYNYGTADFSDPLGLSWDVFRGEAQFWVSVSTFDEMMRHYESENRTVFRQVLALTESQALAMSTALATDALPENRFYDYDHLTDNCATRLRDHIDGNSGGALSRSATDYEKTYRTLIRPGLGSVPGLDVGTEIFLGRRLDKPITTYEAMFLPHLLREGVEKRLGGEPEILYRRNSPVEMGSERSAPLMLWWVSAGLGLTLGLLTITRRPRVSRAGRVISGILLGSIGTLLLVGLLVSNAAEIRYNENLLLCLPTDFLLLSGSRHGRGRYAVIRLAGLGATAALLLAGVLIQPLWPLWTFATLVMSGTWLASKRSGSREALHPASR